MVRPVKRIVIVGGGTAGWLAAALTAARFRPMGADAPSVTLVESPDIPTVGVGEGTWPTMRATLAAIGINETDFLTACDASFKQGSRFDGWLTGAPDEHYYHPFTAPPEAAPGELAAAWASVKPAASFAEAMTAQVAACDSSLAPRQKAMPDWAGALNYAYHLDAAKFAKMLAAHAVDRLGVKRLFDHVVAVEGDDADGIAAVVTRANGQIEGDLFLDCSGHSALLIGDHLRVPFVDQSKHLFNDRALATQVPVEPGSPIASQTIGTAHRAGWIWDIGLPHRRGVGCVYSSSFMSDDEAESALRAYISDTASNDQAANVAIRRLVFPTGHRAEFWRGNCLALGLSAGFVEPLEASAIVLIELSVKTLLDNYPVSREVMPIHARRFNALFTTRWQRIVEFLKLHYVLSWRDEPYWRAHRDSASFPDRLADLLVLWEDQPPSAYDLPLADEIFPAASYQYVWFGMTSERPAASKVSPALAGQLVKVGQRARVLKSALPTNRAYLDALAPARRAALPTESR